MKNPIILPLALACAIAACSTVNVSGQGGTPQAGANGGSAGVQGGSTLGTIAVIATIAALIGLSRDSPSHGAPGMLEGRAISEVDCTQPIADWSKNLKCR